MLCLFWINQGLAVSGTAPATKPNIIVFLVDDMGWQDTSVPFHTKKNATEPALSHSQHGATRQPGDEVYQCLRLLRLFPDSRFDHDRHERRPTPRDRLDTAI